jgi:hypothetical protein
MRTLKESTYAAIDVATIITIGVAFAGIMVIAYIIWKMKDQLVPTLYGSGFTTDLANQTWNNTYRNVSFSIGNITGGFDSAVNLILVAITIFILAIAISALLLLRR